MPNFGSTAPTRKPGTKPAFSGTGAGFLTQPALIGELIIVTPVSIEKSIYNEGKPDARESTRLKADVVVLTGPNKGEHPNMLLSGSPIWQKGQEILEEKRDEVLLGRMIRKPLKKYKDNWASPAELEAAIADPAVVVPNNAYSWLIPDANAADIALATAYYEGGTIPDADDEDPYAD